MQTQSIGFKLGNRISNITLSFLKSEFLRIGFHILKEKQYGTLKRAASRSQHTGTVELPDAFALYNTLGTDYSETLFG